MPRRCYSKCGMCACTCGRVHRAALWILGEYCSNAEDVQNLMMLIRQSLGNVSVRKRVTSRLF